MAGRTPPAPPGRAALRAFRERLARGWPPGLTTLSGDDRYHLDRAERELLAALVPQEASAFALTVVSEVKTDVGAVVALARSAGMFAPSRVVLVRDVQVLDGDPEPLVRFAERPPPNSYLVVRAPALDRRRKLHQALAGSGTLVVFGATVDRARFAAEVAEIAAEKSLALDRGAAAFLADACAGDLYRAEGELEKIRVWIGGEGPAPVTLDTVREIVAGSGLPGSWAVSDALLARDLPQAFAALRRLAEVGEEPLKILGGMAYRARGMLAAKAHIERGLRPEQAARAANLWGGGSEGLARYSLAELLAFPAALAQADRDLKSRGLAPWAVLEATVARMIARESGPTP